MGKVCGGSFFGARHWIWVGGVDRVVISAEKTDIVRYYAERSSDRRQTRGAGPESRRDRRKSSPGRKL